MIYLENITTEQTVLIPANWPAERTSMSFSLRNTTSAGQGYGEVVAVRQDGGYFVFSITLPAGMNNGEYEYELRYETQVYASGLCQVGRISRPISQGEGGFTLKQAK